MRRYFESLTYADIDKVTACVQTMSMCKSIENVCDYDACFFSSVFSLPSVLFAFCLSFVVFLLLIWHHERGLGLLTGITDSGGLFFYFYYYLFFELVIYKHYGLSCFFVYICITLPSFCRTALGRSTKLKVFSPCIFYLFRLCVCGCVWVFQFRCFVFLSFLLSGW